MNIEIAEFEEDKRREKAELDAAYARAWAAFEARATPEQVQAAREAEKALDDAITAMKAQPWDCPEAETLIACVDEAHAHVMNIRGF